MVCGFIVSKKRASAIRMQLTGGKMEFTGVGRGVRPDVCQVKTVSRHTCGTAHYVPSRATHILAGVLRLNDEQTVRRPGTTRFAHAADAVQ